MVSNALLFILSYMKYYLYPGMFVFTSDQMVHACLTAHAFIICVLYLQLFLYIVYYAKSWEINCF